MSTASVVPPRVGDIVLCFTAAFGNPTELPPAWYPAIVTKVMEPQDSSEDEHAVSLTVFDSGHNAPRHILATYGDAPERDVWRHRPE